jgi:hypothetical protein
MHIYKYSMWYYDTICLVQLLSKNDIDVYNIFVCRSVDKPSAQFHLGCVKIFNIRGFFVTCNVMSDISVL